MNIIYYKQIFKLVRSTLVGEFRKAYLEMFLNWRSVRVWNQMIEFTWLHIS